MEIDHIFIFSNTNGKEADDLIDFGFIEGSNRLHPGQGTTNRKFYFENFFLEVLWVINEKEIQSTTTSKTKLWERSQFQKNGCSPFGLCLVNTGATDNLFAKSEIYQPNYFPKGMAIDIITNEKNPQLPWTFRLPYRDKKNVHNEPKEHPNGIKVLTRVKFEINNETTAFDKYFENLKEIDFKRNHRTHLTLEFDNNVQGKEKEFSALHLTIKY